MKKVLRIIIVLLFIACSSNTEKDRLADLIKAEMENPLPFNDIKIAKVNNGTAVIVDESWCFWIDNDNQVFCVNGTAHSTIKNCKDAPIDKMFSDIEEIAK